MFQNSTLQKIGENYHKTVAQVILRFLIQEKIVAIPKSSKKERMAENFAIFDFQLSETEYRRIRQLNEERSLFGWP